MNKPGMLSQRQIRTFLNNYMGVYGGTRPLIELIPNSNLSPMWGTDIRTKRNTPRRVIAVGETWLYKQYHDALHDALSDLNEVTRNVPLGRGKPTCR